MNSESQHINISGQNFYTFSAAFKKIFFYLFFSYLLLPVQAGSGYVSIRDYLPESWPADGSVDLRPMIEQALAENNELFFPGSLDPGDPIIYPITPTLVIPENRRIRFAPNARFLRIPSAGRALLLLKDGVVLDSVVVDGNKYAHWPEFKDINIHAVAIALTNHNLVTDSVVFNNPGIGFGNWVSPEGKMFYTGNRLYRCVAENVGMLDVRFGAMFYPGGDWDNFSADGFYIAGSDNLIKDCVAYDCQRWGYATAHAGSCGTASNNTYVDCKGADVHFLGYGFIDIEGAGENNRLIRCQSPNNYIAVSGSPRTDVIQCMASAIYGSDTFNPGTIELYAYRGQSPRIDGNLLTGLGNHQGLNFGGRRGDRLHHGALSPIVTNNRIYKMSPYTSHYSDASFSVHSINGSGIVANNILFEFDDGSQRGPGMQLLGIEGVNNKVVYGQWKLELNIPTELRYGWYDPELTQRRNHEYAVEFLHDARRLYRGVEAVPRPRVPSWRGGPEWVEEIADAEIIEIKWLPYETDFYPDPEDLGEASGWTERPPEDITPMQMRLGRHWGIELPGFRGPGWHYLPISWPEISEGQELYLYLAGIDSEAKAFVDGRKVARHSSWNQPSVHKINPEVMNREDSLFALKIWTPAGQCGSYGPVGLIVVEK